MSYDAVNMEDSEQQEPFLHARHSKYFIRFLNYAKGSSGEFRNKLTILNQAGKIGDEVFNDLYLKSTEFSSKTKSLIDYLKKFEGNKKKN